MRIEISAGREVAVVVYVHNSRHTATYQNNSYRAHCYLPVTAYGELRPGQVFPLRESEVQPTI
jgi:hypothetical protein